MTGRELVAQPEPTRPPLPLYLADEPIVGYRVWRIDPDHRLRSLAKPFRWPRRRELQALCWKHSFPFSVPTSSHRAPWPDCQCGIWAFKDEDAAGRTCWPSAALLGARAVGTVSLWGRVLDCPLGFRAEYAYPRSLILYDPNLRGRVSEGLAPADQLADSYGIPVEVALPPPPSVEVKLVGGWGAAPAVEVKLVGGWGAAQPTAERPLFPDRRQTSLGRRLGRALDDG